MGLETVSLGIEGVAQHRKMPWAFAKRIADASTSVEAMAQAGLDWKINEKQIFTPNGQEYKIVKGHKAIIRADNDDVLSVMKNSYKSLQNDKAFEFFDPFVENGFAKFDVAGSFNGGRLVWIVAKLNKDPIVVGGDDTIDKYLVLGNSHDGTMSVRAGFSPLRPSCSNMVMVALNHADAQILRIRHSTNLNENLSKVRDAINAVDQKFEASTELYQRLAKIGVNEKDLEKYVSIVFPYKAFSAADKMKDTFEQDRERDILRIGKIKAAIQSLFEEGAGSEFKTARGTMWGAYNAVTAYLTHYKGEEDSSRLRSNWFGDNNRINKRAFAAAFKPLEEVVVQ